MYRNSYPTSNNEARALEELRARIVTTAATSAFLEYDTEVDPLSTESVIGGGMIVVKTEGIENLPVSSNRILAYVKENIFAFVQNVVILPGESVIEIVVKKPS